MIKRLLPLILILFAILPAACANEEMAALPAGTITPPPVTATPPEPTATVTPSPRPTNTPTPTSSPTRSATATPTSTPTPTAAIWVDAGTPVPDPQAITSAQNATQITELARWGRGVITDIDLSADGRWIAVASGSGVYIHDSQDLSAEPRTIQTIGNVTAVSISPAGDRVALALLEGEVQLWQVEPARKLVSTGYMAEQLQFSPDGTALAVIPSVFASDSLRLVDSNDGRTLVAYGGVGARFSPSGDRIAVWDDETVVVHDWREGGRVFEKEVAIHHEETEYLHLPVTGSAAFLSEETLRLLVREMQGYIYMTGRVEMQRAEDDTVLFSVPSIGYLSSAISYVCNEPIIFPDPPEPAQARYMELSTDGQVAAILYKDLAYSGDFAAYSSLQFFQMDSGQNLYTVEEGIIDFELMPDGESWVAGFQDGRLQVRQLSDGSVLDSVDGYESPILDVTVSPDDQWVAVSYVDEVKIYHRERDDVQYRYPADIVAFSPDGTSFALGYEDGRVEARNLADGSLIGAAAHEDRVTALAYTSAEVFISAGFDCNINLWQLPDLSHLGTLENFMVEGAFTGEQVAARVRDLIVLPGRQSVVGKFFIGDFAVWSLEDRRLLRAPQPYEPGQPYYPSSILAVSADGNLLVVPNGRVPESWDSSLNFVETEAWPIAISPDASLLAGEERVVGQISELKIWDISSMSLLHAATPWTVAMTAVTFTGDGQLLLTAGMDGIVRLWGIP